MLKTRPPPNSKGAAGQEAPPNQPAAQVGDSRWHRKKEQLPPAASIRLREKLRGCSLHRREQIFQGTAEPAAENSQYPKPGRQRRKARGGKTVIPGLEAEPGRIKEFKIILVYIVKPCLKYTNQAGRGGPWL